jgi:ankyrin repeat protein
MGAHLDAPYKKTIPLIEAIRQGHKEVVEALIKAGSDVNAIYDLEVGSPLQQAIETRNLDIEDLLRKAGAHD